MELLKKRRTIRKFKQTAIDTDILYDFVDCARLAPSAANMQPLKYIAENRADMCAEIFPLTKWAGYLDGHGTPKPGEEPTAYIIILNDTNIRRAGYELDAGAAAMSIITAAEARGIASCWIGSIDREKLAGLYSLPDNLQIITMVALGYPSEESQITEYVGDIKYYKDKNGCLHVPKRSLEEILLKF